MPAVLEVKDLILYYRTRRGVVRAVDKISFILEKGQTLAIVGESGCGKSSTANAIFRLLPRNVHRYEGQVLINGEDTMKLDDETYRKKIRWQKISMVFQGAMNSLNPVLKVGFQIAEPLMIHKGVDKKEAIEKAKEALKLVGIHPSFVERYPFELSGGMKQRVCIAMALITEPEIVILDEPTSALDVITQANIMNLLKKLQWEKNLSYIFITHDIPLTSELADYVAVMYAGQIVELSPAAAFYKEPKHPYAFRLMASVPTLRSKKELDFIPGRPPDLAKPPPGCRFHPRCRRAMDICKKEEPPVVEIAPGHYVKCWLYAK